MADVRPFSGIRYDERRASFRRALCPPYDVIDAAQAARLRRDPLNAIHLELPEGTGENRYAAAAGTWERWARAQVLRRDAAPSFYVCEERFALNGKAMRRVGFMAALGVSDEAARAVVPHERTLPKPKADRLKLLAAVRANVSPIFAILPDPSGAARRALAKVMRSRPAAQGRAASGVRYRLWAVREPALEKAAARRKLLIADGHHRFEVGRAYYKLNPRPGADTILAYLCPEQDAGLAVLPTHRVVAFGAVDEKELAAECRLSRCRSRSEMLARLERSANLYAFGLWDARGYRLAEPRSAGGCRSGLCVEWIGRRLLRRLAPDQIRYFHDAARSEAEARKLGGAAVFVKPCS